MLQEAGRQALEGCCGDGLRASRAWARHWLARLRFAWPFGSEDERYRAFLEVWNSLGDWAVTRYAARHPTWAVGEDQSTLDLLPGDVPAAALFGFHVRETWNGRAFRWTAPFASLFLQLPRGDYDLTLDTQGIRPPASGAQVHVYWNGHPAHPLPLGRFREWTVRITSATFAQANPQVLTIACDRLRASDPQERRALGLPLFGIHFRQAEQQPRNPPNLAA
jgi:hypothetical protein